MKKELLKFEYENQKEYKKNSAGNGFLTLFLNFVFTMYL